ncbi:PLP-dependent transferase [Aureobasidium sp. EXF-12298]|nr:PLP-dependent transferase [Aureobasidium sp. EXF-12298]
MFAEQMSSDFPQLKDVIYLDSAGTPVRILEVGETSSLISRSDHADYLIDRVHEDLRSNLYANPHSNSGPAQAVANDIQSVRTQILIFFGANTEDWDVIFTANATAAIKLTADCFRDYAERDGKGFWYGYHRDSHTSLVGARELARVGAGATDEANRCFLQDEDIDKWILQSSKNRHLPGRADGYRITDLASETYTLLDAAALASTSFLDLSDTATSPDFVAVSFYKIFGYPQLGALIVQRRSARPLLSRRYFGGGTVDMVTTSSEGWHVKKTDSPHDALEDGTPATHAIIAIKHAINCYQDKYGHNPMQKIASHTSRLAKDMATRLSGLRHNNGTPVVRLYSDLGPGSSQGPVMAFNVLRADGSMVAYSEVERLANEHKICLRTGSLCNPGGLAGELGWTAEELQQAFEAGHRCSKPESIVLGKATGVVRVSLGMHNSESDVRLFILFIARTFLMGHELQHPACQQASQHISLITVS